MSILIRGMDMPDDCKTCDLCHYDGFMGFCFVNDEKIAKKGRREDCPLVEVPTPHGRLIDADEVRAMYDRQSKDKWNNKTAPVSWAVAFEEVAYDIAETPTIIEAEGE